MVGVYVGTREDNLAECLRIIADQFRLMGEGGFDPDELQRAKENLKGRIMLSMESTSNRASRLGKSVLTDTELLSLDRICAEIDAVDAEAVAAARTPAVRTRAALGGRHRPRPGALLRGAARAQPRTGRDRGAYRRSRSARTTWIGRRPGGVIVNARPHSPGISHAGARTA